MKIAREYAMLAILGLYIFGYLLDLIVQPLQLTKELPYAYFDPNYMASFPFSFVSISVKALAIFCTPLWIVSFWGSKGFAKPVLLLVVSALLQLYAVQDVVSRAQLVPLEWSLALTAAGVGLIIPIGIFLVSAVVRMVRQTLTSDSMVKAIQRAKEDDTGESAA